MRWEDNHELWVRRALNEVAIEYHLLGYNTVYSVVNRRFGRTYRLHLQGRLPPVFTLLSCSAYFFDPEDGGDMFL
jgi:hypothetical protein